MLTNRDNQSETSVTFSLAELAKIEHERVREEEQRRAEEIARASREAHRAELARRAAESARIAADEEARARRLKAEAEEQARTLARERAELEIARIAAEARARLEEGNAARAHEIEVLRVRTASRGRRLTGALAAALAIVLAGGVVFAYRSSAQAAALTEDADRLRQGQQALAKEREHAKATELTALDRRYVALVARPCIREAEDARLAAESARKAIDPKALDHDRLLTFADALDALDAKLYAGERLAALDKRRDDLLLWAGEQRQREATANVKSAALQARATGDLASLKAYDAALDQLRAEIARAPVAVAGRVAVTTKTSGAGPAHTCPPGDPGCDTSGKPLF